jgi:hypothetical protein
MDRTVREATRVARESFLSGAHEKAANTRATGDLLQARLMDRSETRGSIEDAGIHLSVRTQAEVPGRG